MSDLYRGEGCVEVTARVLRADGSGDIVDQYANFCRIADEQRRLYGYTRKAVEETIRLCRERDILDSFLASRKKEVTDIMFALFDQEEVRKIREYNVAKKAEEKGIFAMVVTLRAMEKDKDTIHDALMQQFSLSPSEATRKMELYWDQKNMQS